MILVRSGHFLEARLHARRGSMQAPLRRQGTSTNTSLNACSTTTPNDAAAGEFPHFGIATANPLCDSLPLKYRIFSHYA